MAQIVEGALDGDGMRIGIVVARFNESFTERLLEGARECLQQHGVADADVHIVRVPGAFEIPLVARTMARSGKVDAVVCLGAVIRGATAHFEYVSSAAAAGVSQVGLETDMPVIFGVLTTHTLDQTRERCGDKEDNKGWESALAAIETLNALRQLRREDR